MKTELQNIIEKAHSLYMKYGIKSVSMDDIARELSMSKKTLYVHIKDKTDLVSRTLKYENITRVAFFDKACNSQENAIDELIKVNTFVENMLKEKSLSFEFDLQKYYPKLFAQLSEFKHKKMYKSISENIKKGKKEGIYRAELKTEIITGLYVTRITSSHFFNFLFNTETKHSEIHRELIIYHIRGLANEKGLEILDEKIKNKEI